ncbi:phage tail tube protein [Sapientia aquatica]|uniref:Uncharacterized protein n=1 Tax=Sapientia aquatica TaxID=1549640 RepID=A0A4R5VYL9_9BURK|nr:phage tail tube protein [Sapientia aquatica]TDK63551.1 hypothetical protein E2I14_15230 [Sapientia aquatica]
MQIAVGSRSAIGAVVETVWGTTPATPALLDLPFTTFNVNKTLDKFNDTSIQGDRMMRPSVTGNTHITGDLDVNYQPLNYDNLLASLFNSTWVTNVLKIGQVQSSFTFEHSQLDISQFWQYTGMVVDKLQLKLSTSGLVTAKFTLIGKDSPTPTVVSVDTTAGTGVGGFYSAPTAAPPFTHNGGTFKEGGSAFASFMSLDITFDNKTAANFGLGGSTAASLTSNYFEVTGSASVYVQDAVMYNKFIEATSTTLEFTLANGTNTHDYLIPNVRYHGATKAVTGQGPVTMTLPFVGFYDSTSGSNAVITRT